MAGDATTIARPYAEAIFARAVETDKLDLWSDMLELLASAAQDPALAGLIASGELKAAIAGTYTLDEFLDAYAHQQRTGTARKGKIIIRPNG